MGFHGPNPDLGHLINGLQHGVTPPDGLVYSADLVEQVDSLDNWAKTGSSAPGSVSVLAGDGPDGEDVIRISVDSAGGSVAMEYAEPVPGHYRRGYLGQWVRMPNTALANRQGYYVWREPAFSSGAWQSQFYNYNSANTRVLHDGDWFFKMFRGDQLSPVDAPAWSDDTNGVDSWHILNYQAPGDGGIVDFGALYADMRHRPKLIIGFDDGYETDYTNGLPYLQAREIPATIYPITTQIGEPDYLTTDQMDALQAAGWTVGLHHGNPINALTPDQIETEVTAAINWLGANGYTGAQHLAWVQGNYTPNAAAIMRRLGVLTGRTAEPECFPWVPQLDLMYRPAYLLSDFADAAAGLAALDICIALGGVMELYVHEMPDPSDDFTKFKGFVDGAVTRIHQGKLDAVNVETAYDLLRTSI